MAEGDGRAASWAEGMGGSRKGKSAVSWAVVTMLERKS